MRRHTLLCAGLLWAAANSAQAQLGAPQLGWVPDQGRIRPVSGIPAAAAVGAAIDAGPAFQQIAASPARNYVLVSAVETGTVSIYVNGQGLTPLDGAGSAPDSIVLSPSGSSAALWFSSLHRAQVITGLPDTADIRQVDASFLADAPDALAVSDDGQWLAGSWQDGLFVFGPSGEVNRLPLEEYAAALAFFHGKHDLVVATSHGIRLVTGIGGFAQIATLVDAGDSTPAAVAVASDNGAVVLANRSGSVVALDLLSGAATTTDCGCSPEGLFGMGPSVFRLTGLSNRAFQLFDAAHGEVLWVPLALDEGGAQ